MVKMTDGKGNAPYQIRSEKGKVWLEDTRDGKRYFESNDTFEYRKGLKKLRAKHNTNWFFATYVG